MHQRDLLDLWQQHKSRVKGFILKRVERKQDAEDIAHEVFIKFWEKHHTIQDTGKTLAWLYTVARNLIHDYYRAGSKEKQFLAAKPVRSCSHSHDESEQSTDESKKLLPIINSLPVKYKNVIMLSQIYGFPHKVIARQFDLSLSCVKTRIVRGRKLLGEKMHECCKFSHDKYGNIVDCQEKKAYFNLKK